MSCSSVSTSSQTIGRRDGRRQRTERPAKGTGHGRQSAARGVSDPTQGEPEQALTGRQPEPQHDRRSDVGGHHREAVDTGQLRQQAAQSAGQLVGMAARG